MLVQQRCWLAVQLLLHLEQQTVEDDGKHHHQAWGVMRRLSVNKENKLIVEVILPKRVELNFEGAIEYNRGENMCVDQ
jgi:hypothetical protein